MITFLPLSELIIRIVLSILLGALIGLEREMGDKAAGLRTHLLVCLGSTLFTIVSISITWGDPGRIAAGIVTGIGFLGAGSIFKEQDRVKGITTAADIWVAGAIGLAVGVGYYHAAIIVAVLAFAILVSGRILKTMENTGKQK